MIEQIQAPIVETVNPDGTEESTRAPRAELWQAATGDSRQIPDSVLARIDAMAPKAEEAEEEIDPPADSDAVEEEAEVVAESAAAEPVAEATSEAATTEAERLAAANAALVAELEAARAAQPAIPEPLTKLGQAAESYLDDDQAAIRSFIAHSIGVDDPNHKDVDAELEYLYTSLTAKSLGVTPDSAQQAAREHARTRQLLARQKRERHAEGAESASKAKAEAEAKQAQDAAAFIGNRLQSSSGDYPLTMRLAQVIDGVSAPDLIWRTIQRETKVGRFDKDTLADDNKLIAAAAKLIETRYQAIANNLPPPSTTTSTVTPNAKASAANESSAKSAQPSKARTLTNADASVAPAAPAKSAKPTEKPKFKTDAERRDWALRRLPK